MYPFFSSEKHVCAVPQGDFERWYISCDYGTVNPSSFGLWGLLDGIWYRVDEYYHDSRVTGVQCTDEEYYTALEKLADGREISAVAVDPSAASFIECIRRHGRFRVVPAKNDVTDGIRKASEALRAEKIKICTPCRDIIREFSLYRWDSNCIKDTPCKKNDHAMDDMRYFVTTLMSESDCGIFAIATERKE